MLLSHVMLMYYLANDVPCGVIPLPIVARGQFNCLRLVLLPLMVLLGQCYCHIYIVVLAGVIARVAMRSYTKHQN